MPLSRFAVGRSWLQSPAFLPTEACNLHALPRRNFYRKTPSFYWGVHTITNKNQWDVFEHGKAGCLLQCFSSSASENPTIKNKETRIITRNQLVRKVVKKTDQDAKKVTQCVHAVFDIIEQAVVDGQDVKIHKFGRFCTRRLQPQIFRLPFAGKHKGKIYHIPARLNVKFRPSGIFRKRINKARTDDEEDIDEDFGEEYADDEEEDDDEQKKKSLQG